jgi:hypothetical protein
MDPKPSREEFLEAWQEFLEEQYEQFTLDMVQEAYEEILLENLESHRHVADLPEEQREYLAETGAKIYAEQAEKILESTHLDHEEVELAAATAFLQQNKQVKIGAQAKGIIDIYWSQIESETTYSKQDLQNWTTQTLINPWPPQHLQENHESVDRFKPPQEDPTYM